MFTPDQLAQHVQDLLQSQSVSVPDAHHVAFFTGLTTDGLKAAVAWRPSHQHDWTVNLYDQLGLHGEGNDFGVTFKGSL